MPDIAHMIQIAAPTDAVYPLVATAKGLAEWWAADVTETNGAAELGFFKRNTVYRLRLTAHEPSRRAEWICETGAEWEGTHLIFELESQASGSRLRFTHGAWRSATDYFTSCNTTWGALMMRLKAAAEGKSPGPLFSQAGMAY